MKRLFGTVAVFVAGMLVAFVLSPRAWAHAHMVKSSPADHAVLTGSPAVIRAWFSEELAAQGSVMRLYDAHQKLLAQGGLDPAFSSHEVLRLIPPHLGPGSYMVAWHSVSSDDQAMTQGYFRFSIGTAMQMPPAQSAGQMGSMQGMPSSGVHAGSLPMLHLVAPANRARLHNPVSILIETPADISLVTMGPKMMSGPGVHLHIVVDGIVNMPASDQLVASGAHRYSYELSPLKPGAHTIEVFWADNHTHAPVGGTQEVTVVVL
ncbi:MAG TPA: copper resistance protein CopC [bacterium]|nr:copper resistance protein CopC [bacterium]